MPLQNVDLHSLCAEHALPSISFTLHTLSVVTLGGTGEAAGAGAGAEEGAGGGVGTSVGADWEEFPHWHTQSQSP